MARFAKTVAITSWGGAVVACLAHNQEVGGSSPSPITFPSSLKWWWISRRMSKPSSIGRQWCWRAAKEIRPKYKVSKTGRLKKFVVWPYTHEKFQPPRTYAGGVVPSRVIYRSIWACSSVVERRVIALRSVVQFHPSPQTIRYCCNRRWVRLFFSY